MKEYSGIINEWHDSKSADLAPEIRQLTKSIADLVKPKMAFLSSTDWTRSMFIDHIFVSAFQTLGIEENLLKSHMRWNSDTTTVDYNDRIADSSLHLEAQMPTLLIDWKLD